MPDYTVPIAYGLGFLTATVGVGLVSRPSRMSKAVVGVIGLVLTYILLTGVRGEGFATSTNPNCSECGSSWPCPDHKDTGVSPVCPPQPDMSKYVLKTSIPPCPNCPDLDKYMLKTECPPVPDMSQYVLKSSVPKQEPIIIDSTACKGQCGDCPPCPRPRCPEVKCPAPTVCPACPPCPRPSCPQQVVKCKSEDVASSPVRPFLAPLGIPGFGM